MNKKVFLSITVLCALVFSTGLFVGNFFLQRQAQKTFLVDIPHDTKVKVYLDLGGDGPFHYDASKPLFTLTEDREITTRVGVYDFVIENGDSYVNPVTKYVVNKGTSVVSVNPAYKEEKLNELLIVAEPSIIESIRASFPELDMYYSVDKVKLFERGEWAGVLLSPKLSKYDSVRLVLRKTDNWHVVNSPSIMVIGSLNKTIPKDVIVGTNRF